MVERKLFSQIRCINIVYLNVETMIVLPITKRMEIIMCIKVCLISQMKLIIWKMVERKLLLQVQSISIMYPIMEDKIAMPIAKRTEIVTGIQVCLI